MSSVNIGSLSNANVYIGAIGFLGEASEVEVPHPKQILVDYKGLGMRGKAKIATGTEALECTIKWASFDPVAIGLSVLPTQAQLFQVRGSLEQQGALGTSAELPVVYLMTGTFHDAGKPAFKQHELVETTTMINVVHSELYVAGVQVFVFDLYANIYTVGGIDQLASFRSNIGG